MAKGEVAQKLFYVDKLYDEKKINNKNPEEVKKIINLIKKEVMALTLEDIRNGIEENKFLKRLEGKYCKLIEIELDELCVCDIHQSQFRNSDTSALRGELFINIVKELNKETLKRVNNVSKIVSILIQEIPSIVRKFGKKYEVLMGNHRLLSLIKDGEKTCKVLCICEEHEAQDFPNLDFSVHKIE